MLKEPQTIEERFWSKVNKTATCWLWTRAVSGAGYGQFWLNAEEGMDGAHRFAYKQIKGAIPEGLHLDHLCRVPRCVNPDHLEAVTPAENLRRGSCASAENSRKTHCKAGHLLEGDNLIPRSLLLGKRHCRPCKRILNRDHMRRKRIAFLLSKESESNQSIPETG